MSLEDHVLFCGVTVGSRLSRLLEELGPSARSYVGGEPFLSMREINGKQVLGRPVQAGLPVAELEDFARNVRSILRKIFPEERLPESDVRLYVTSMEAKQTPAPGDGAEPEPEGEP